MKYIYFFCLLIGYSTLSYPQETHTFPSVTGNYNNENLTGIFNDLSSRYNIRFFYKDQWIGSNQISLKFTNMPLPDLLDSILNPSGLSSLYYSPFMVVIIRSEDMALEFSQNYFINKREQENFLSSNDLSRATDHIILGDTSNAEIPREALLNGRIIDGQNDLPLGSVNINFETVNKILTTGYDGKFSIKLPTGRHFVIISYVGYETRKIVLDFRNTADWKVILYPKPIELDEVQITGNQEVSLVHSTIAGITSLTSRDIKFIPVFMGEADVIKSLLTLPGVSSTGEGTEGFHVRGGNVDQNLILQDQAIIFNSSHALGFFSVFNPDLVSRVTLYKGHIPAQFGGRISSVLDVHLKEFNNDKLELNGGIGILTSRFSMNSPMFNHNTSVLLGGRVTYSDWVLGNIDVPSLHNSAASFYDFNIKISQKLPAGGMLTTSAYRSYDHVQFAKEFGFKWGTEAYSLSWAQLLNKKYDNNLSYTFGHLANRYIKPGDIDAYILSNGLNYHKVKDEINLPLFLRHDITAGFEGILYLASPDRMDPLTSLSQVIPQSITRENGIETALFINDEYSINDQYSLSAGLRYNFFESLGPAVVTTYEPGRPFGQSTVTDSLIYRKGQRTSSFNRPEPRLSFKYNINAISSVKASYDRLNQFIHLISNTVSPIPVDLWQVSNRYLPPEFADNYSVGYYRILKRNLYETSIELYYRDSGNIPMYRNFADLTLNQHIETEIISAKGKSFGAEFFFRKTRGNPKGWISYTLSRSRVRSGNTFTETTINDGYWFSTFYDKPHLLNIVFDLQVRKGFNLSLNYSYASGRPVTAPTANYYYKYYYIPYFPKRNGFRIPYYSRLDASVTIRRNVVRNHRYTDSVTFSIYNLLSRDNPFSVYFRRNIPDNAYAYKLSILGNAFPSVTYNFTY